MTQTATAQPSTSGAGALYPSLVRPETEGRGPVPRTALQRQSIATLSRHFRRALVRNAVLLLADAATFLAFRWLVLEVRDHALVGGSVGARVQHLIPQGYLGGLEEGVALLIGLVLTGTYGRGDARRDAGRLFLGVSLAVALSMWSSLWSVGIEVLLLYAAAVLVLWMLLSVERSLVDRLVRVAGWRRPRTRTVFVGPLEDCHGAASSAAFSEGSQYRVVGFVDVPRANHPTTVGLLRQGLVSRRAETVVICGYLSDEVYEHVTQAAREAGCQLLAVPKRFKRTGVKPHLFWECDQPLIELTSPALTRRHLMIKRAIDIVGAGVGLLLLSPILIIIAALVKLTSPGPAFFSHERVGYGGRVFRMVKFRTMRQGADEEKADLEHLNTTGDNRLFKIPNDPRVTKVGALLRKWSIDELPQLWNVLKGDMSLVGPRPFFEADLDGYADHHFARLGAKPGITGLWQVKGRSSVVDFEEVVRLDREYIDRWSVWLDLKILAFTIPAVFRRTGAY